MHHRCVDLEVQLASHIFWVHVVYFDSVPLPAVFRLFEYYLHRKQEIQRPEVTENGHKVRIGGREHFDGHFFL